MIRQSGQKVCTKYLVNKSQLGRKLCDEQTTNVPQIADKHICLLTFDLLSSK